MGHGFVGNIDRAFYVVSSLFDNSRGAYICVRQARYGLLQATKSSSAPSRCCSWERNGDATALVRGDRVLLRPYVLAVQGPQHLLGDFSRRGACIYAVEQQEYKHGQNI